MRFKIYNYSISIIMYSSQNITFEIEESHDIKTHSRGIVSHSELVKEVEYMELMKDETENEDCNSLEEEYDLMYSTGEIHRICEYYHLSNNKSKQQLILDIILFEKNPDNFRIVYRRKKLWDYMKEIKEDAYLSKYLILD